jgi:Holliday junction resolvase RusA-like endonuclease
MIIHTVELPIELTNGNDGRGGKWFSSAKVRKQIEMILIAGGHRRAEPFDGPVSLLITRVMKKRQSAWDADSWQRGNLKELIDALVSVNWFVDDGPRYISEVRFRQRADNPRPKESTTIVEVMRG